VSGTTDDGEHDVNGDGIAHGNAACDESTPMI